MTPAESQALRETLRRLATSIGPPGTSAEIQIFENNKHVTFHSEIKEFLSLVSYISCIGDYLVSVGPLDRFQRISPNCEQGNLFIIGDILIESDYIVANVEDPAYPISLLGDGQIVAPGFTAFIEGLVAGNLDVRQPS